MLSYEMISYHPGLGAISNSSSSDVSCNLFNKLLLMTGKRANKRKHRWRNEKKISHSHFYKITLCVAALLMFSSLVPGETTSTSTSTSTTTSKIATATSRLAEQEQEQVVGSKTTKVYETTTTTSDSCSFNTTIIADGGGGASLSSRKGTTTTHDSDRNQSAYQSDHSSSSSSSFVVAPVVIGQQQQQEHRQHQSLPFKPPAPAPAPAPSSAISSPQQEQQPPPLKEQITIEPHPSQFLQLPLPLQQRQRQPTTATTRTDRWRAFNKCNSSKRGSQEDSDKEKQEQEHDIGIGIDIDHDEREEDGEEGEELDKQLAGPIKAPAAAAVDNRGSSSSINGSRSSNSSIESSSREQKRRRIRRHIDVGHQIDRLVASSSSNHQTSFSSLDSFSSSASSSSSSSSPPTSSSFSSRPLLSAQAGLLSWPQGKQQQQEQQSPSSSPSSSLSSSSSSLPIDRKVKRKRLSSEGEPLIGSVGDGHLIRRPMQQASGNLRPAKAIPVGEPREEEEQEDEAGTVDDDDDETTDAEAQNVASRQKIKYQPANSSMSTATPHITGRDNKGRHIQATDEMDTTFTTTTTGTGSGISSRSKERDFFRPDNKMERIVRKISSGQVNRQRADAAFDSFKVDENDVDRDTTTTTTTKTTTTVTGGIRKNYRHHRPSTLPVHDDKVSFSGVGGGDNHHSADERGEQTGRVVGSEGVGEEVGRRKAEEVEGDDDDDGIISHHNLIEIVDDDLFLAKGSPPAEHSLNELHNLIYTTTMAAAAAASPPNHRGSRSSGDSSQTLMSSSLVLDKIRTIYFGGFFPWLADEDTRLSEISSVTSYPQANSNDEARHLANSRIYINDNNSNNININNNNNNNNNKSTTSIERNRTNNENLWTRQKKQQKQGQNQNQQQQQQQLLVQTQRRRKQYETGDELLDSSTRAAAQSQSLASFQQNGGQVLSSSSSVPLSGSFSSSATDNNNNNRHQLGRFILPAVRLALDHINTNSSILGTYKLEIVPRDTQCNATISLKEFFDMVYEEPKKMLLYGDACRVSTDPIAKASYFFDLIQISYADTDPIYTIENYPNFFRVVPSENALSLARIPFIRHFNWTRVGTIYQNLPRYSLPHSKLLTDLERFKIVIKQSVSLPGSIDGLQNRDLGDELRKLKEKDVRIILGNFDEEWALLLFCEAFRERMTGRKYQWILTGVSEDKLWQHYLKKGSECSEQELLIAMDGYIITDITPVTRSQHRTISGMMAHEYSNEYRRRAREMNIAIEENKFYGYVYDGIWAIALALHRVDSQLRYYNRLLEAGKAKLNSELEGITSLLDFDYHKPIWVKLIRNALNKTRFNGVTGTVSFHKNERPGLISFSQFQAFRDMNEVIIGSYDALNDELDLKVGFPIFWRGSSPPIDYTIERVTPFRINRTLFVIISILASFGIVLATVFLTINIKFRNQRYIKMSSPYLNNLIIIGCILTYTSVIILGLDSGLTSEYNFPYICNARAWVLMAGFTLAFGSMFSKTFRVHSIFTNIKLHKKVIKDYKLFMVVFILLTFDVCILIVWQYFDPFYRETNNGTSIQDPDNEDIIIVPEMEHCQSKRMTIFLSVIYVYKGLLMAFGCFLAWETRHVSIPALNDSKYIGLSVYNVVIMCVIGAGLSFVLRDQQDASFVIISIFIIFCSTTTLCLVFVPKLIELKQNPRAGDHRVRATLKTFKKNYHEEAFGAAGCRDIHGNLIGRGYGINLNERIKILLEENTKQRSSLKEKTYELEALTYKYRKIQGMIQSGQYLQALSSTGSANNLKQVASTGQNMPRGSDILGGSKSPTNLLAASTTNQNQSTSSISRISPEIVTQMSDLTMTTTAAAKNNGKLQKSSPLMSSNTQITTTTNTTTSSTNYTSDLCATNTDYSSSSKPTSNQLTTTGSGGNCCAIGSPDSSQAIAKQVVAFECGPESDAKDIQTSQHPNKLVRDIPTGKAHRSSILVQSSSKKRTPTTTAAGGASLEATTTISMKQSPKYTAADSSYCSMGAEYELSDGRKSSYDNLFNVLSYIEDGTTNKTATATATTASTPGSKQSSQRQGVNNGATSNQRRSISRGEYVESKFNRWSAGPFCTLMVRNKTEQQAKGSSVVASGTRATAIGEQADKDRDRKIDCSTSRKTKEEIRASCPDIAAMDPFKSMSTSAIKSSLTRQPIKSNRQQSDARGLAAATDATTATSRTPHREGRLPRTISMIEYLGLSDFDFIARRHDKLVKRKLLESARRKQTEYCCIDESNNQCSCYDQLGAGNADNRCHTQSEADMVFSSGEFANSGDLVRTSSQISCSTCCSLMSPSYVSHSEYLYDEVSHSSGSVSHTEQTNSSNSNDSGSLSAMNCHLESKSSTPSSTYENRESTILNTGVASCSHHKRSLHTHHEHTTPSRPSNKPTTGSPQTPAHQIAEKQRSLCTSGALYGPGSREDSNCSGQVCSNKPARMTPSISNNILEDLTALDSDQELQETSIIKCDILESL